jgi:hypothetical protein
MELLSTRARNAVVITFPTTVDNPVMAQQSIRVLLQDKTRLRSLMRRGRTSPFLLLGRTLKGKYRRDSPRNIEEFYINVIQLVVWKTAWKIVTGVR